MIFVIAASRPDYENMTRQLSKETGYTFVLIDKKEDFNPDNLKRINPVKIFLPHWSYIIPDSIFDTFECVIFHMTDLPFGRGGSPLQNLVSSGIHNTKISALKCVKELDAGPIYLKKDLSLHGSAKEILARSTPVIVEMIKEIIEKNLIPQQQLGSPTLFSRRTPDMSNINKLQDLTKLYDQIRMLDADGYPHAFFETDSFRIEFTDAEKKGDEIVAKVLIKKKVT